MELEYIPSGSSNCPLIRIFGTEQVYFVELLNRVRALADGVDLSVSIAELIDAEESRNCDLIMKLGDKDRGPTGPSAEGTFIWALTPVGWEKVAEFIEPLAVDPKPGTYQWIGGEE